jgi:hypothetical protein
LRAQEGASGGKIVRTPAFVLVSLAALAALAIACGGDDDDEDFSDIVASATAAASRSPSASASATASRSASASPTEDDEGNGEASPSPTASSSPGSAATPSPSPAATETATATATATATQPTAQPTTAQPTATTDTTASYTASVRSIVPELQANITELKNEMFASQTNQTEEAGQKLKARIAAVDGNIAQLRGLSAPSSLSGFAADLESALAELKRGTAALTRAVDNKDQIAGLEAYGALNNGESALSSAMSDLP